MNTDGTDYHEWNLIIDGIKWEGDQHFLGYGWNGENENPSWVLNRFNTNGDPPDEIASHSSPIIELLENTHVVEGGYRLAWYSSDGAPAPLKSWNFLDVCRQSGESYIPHARTATAPDGSNALIMITCQSGPTWFYINPLDGSEIRKLTDFILGENQQIMDLMWSPDGKVAIVTIADRNGRKADVYRFDIEKMLNDPAALPVRLTTDEAMKYGVVWQPSP